MSIDTALGCCPRQRSKALNPTLAIKRLATLLLDSMGTPLAALDRERHEHNRETALADGNVIAAGPAAGRAIGAEQANAEVLAGA